MCSRAANRFMHYSAIPRAEPSQSIGLELGTVRNCQDHRSAYVERAAMVSIVTRAFRRGSGAVSRTELFGDAIQGGRGIEYGFIKMIVHAVGILSGILVMLPDDLGRSKADNAEEELGR